MTYNHDLKIRMCEALEDEATHVFMDMQKLSGIGFNKKTQLQFRISVVHY